MSKPIRSTQQQAVSTDESLALLRSMMLIRAFEEQVRSLAAAGVVPGLVHLCSGQEAVAVGVCSVLRRSDWIASSHRGHGHCLAKGARADLLMAEILGRRTGYSLGRSGTLHVFDAANGNLGTNGIVGGGIPLAAGAALSAKNAGKGDVAACFFGDGALNQGLLFEVMNMAAIWKLPVLFVCENNGYGEFTAIEDVTAGADPVARGKVFDIPSESIDGMDVDVVRQAAERAVARARAGKGPSFLVCTTYRYGGHHVGDQQNYKDDEEVKSWKAKDPITRLAQKLEKSGAVNKEEISALSAEIDSEIKDVVAFARKQPLPTPDDLRVHLYA